MKGINRMQVIAENSNVIEISSEKFLDTKLMEIVKATHILLSLGISKDKIEKAFFVGSYSKRFWLLVDTECHDSSGYQ